MAGAEWDVVYICDWLPPDFGAVGQYARNAARDLAREGRSVVLVGLSSAAHSVEDETFGTGRRRIVRIPASQYDKTRTLARVVWTLRTNLRLLCAAWPYLRRAREVMFTGSPPFFLHAIAPANLVLRRKLTYRITDFHPECAIAERGRAGPALGALLRLTKFWRRRVDRFEVLSLDQKRRLTAMGIDGSRIVLKRDTTPVPVSPEVAPMPRPPAGQGKVLLLYSGNWGIAHDETTFLAAYRAHHRMGSGRVVLWLNATGTRAKRVREVCRVEFLPFVDGSPVPLEDLPALLVTADAHLISLSDPFVGYVLPSKVYAAVASAKPVLFVGSAESDVHLLCTRAAVPHYRRVDVGDVAALEAALEDLADTCLPSGSARELADGYGSGVALLDGVARSVEIPGG